jgi:hypothetical protein
MDLLPRGDLLADLADTLLEGLHQRALLGRLPVRGSQRHRLGLEREVLDGGHAEGPRRRRDDRRHHAGRHAGDVQGASAAAIRPHEQQVMEQPPATLARDVPVHD